MPSTEQRINQTNTEMPQNRDDDETLRQYPVNLVSFSYYMSSAVILICLKAIGDVIIATSLPPERAVENVSEIAEK